MKEHRRSTPHKTAWIVLLAFFVIYTLLTRLFALLGFGEYVETALGQLTTLAVLVPTFTRVSKSKPKNVFRMRKISLSDGFLWFFFGVCTCCMLTLINMPISNFWNGFIELPQAVKAPSDIFEYLLGVLCVAIVPSVCEELLCRGIILYEYEKYSPRCAIIVSAAAFALLHNSLPMLIYTFIMGLVLAFVVIYSRSLYPAMIIHFAVNFFSLTVNYLSESVIPMHILPEFALVINLIFVFLTAVFAIMLITLANAHIHGNAHKRGRRAATARWGVSVSMIIFLVLFAVFQLRLFCE